MKIWGKDCDTHVCKDMQMANKYLKRCSLQLVIRKTQFQDTATSFTLTTSVSVQPARSHTRADTSTRTHAHRHARARTRAHARARPEAGVAEQRACPHLTPRASGPGGRGSGWRRRDRGRARDAPSPVGTTRARGLTAPPSLSPQRGHRVAAPRDRPAGRLLLTRFARGRLCGRVGLVPGPSGAGSVRFWVRLVPVRSGFGSV